MSDIIARGMAKKNSNQIGNVQGTVDDHTSQLADKASQAKVDDLGLNVSLYGGFFDGSTDDAPAIQAAIDAAKVGGRVFIPPLGILNIKSSIVITKPVTIVMVNSYGYTTSYLKAGLANLLMFDIRTYGVKFENVELIGDGADRNTGTTTFFKVFDPTGAAGSKNLNLDEFTLKNCHMSYGATGLNVLSRNWYITNGTTFSNMQNGVVIPNDTSIDQRNLDISDARFHSVNTAINLPQGSNNLKEIKIENNIIDDCTTAITGSAASGSILGNIMTRILGTAINLNNSGNAVNSESRSLNIEDNTIVANPNTTTKGNGIVINNATIVKMLGNGIAGFHYHGISTVNVQYCDIDANTINDCARDISATYDGINLDANSFYNNVFNNHIVKVGGNYRHGIHSDGNENTFGNNRSRGLTAGTEFYVDPTKVARGDTNVNPLRRRTFEVTAMPSSGKYNKGDYAINTSPSQLGTAGSMYVVKGWSRLTTGTNNTLNVDWFEDRALTGN